MHNINTNDTEKLCVHSAYKTHNHHYKTSNKKCLTPFYHCTANFNVSMVLKRGPYTYTQILTLSSQQCTRSLFKYQFFIMFLVWPLITVVVSRQASTIYSVALYCLLAFKSYQSLNSVGTVRQVVILLLNYFSCIRFWLAQCVCNNQTYNGFMKGTVMPAELLSVCIYSTIATLPPPAAARILKAIVWQ